MPGGDGLADGEVGLTVGFRVPAAPGGVAGEVGVAGAPLAVVLSYREMMS